MTATEPTTRPTTRPSGPSALAELDPAAFLDASVIGEDLDAYVASFTGHREVWGELLTENLDRLKKGSVSLAWMDTDAEDSNWGTKVKPSSRGLTMADINRPKGYGTMPEVAQWKNFAPRGSIRQMHAEKSPVIDGYDLMARDDLWAANVNTLYEEAKDRQWNATSDIPWDELEDLPEDLAKASCQLATFLTEVEFVAGDFPARWMWRIPPEFFEVKNFLATQMMDEARHMEVFRKRATIGGGLMHSSPAAEWALKSILESPNHTMGTFLLNLLGEGLVLSIFRAGEFIARTDVDKEIYRRCMQDEARHVSYGTMELKNYLDNAPDRDAALEQMHAFADLGEQIILTALSAPTTLEPIAVLMAGGVDNIDHGMDGVDVLWSVITDEYLQRCERAGFDRRDRCTMPLDFSSMVG